MKIALTLEGDTRADILTALGGNWPLCLNVPTLAEAGDGVVYVPNGDVIRNKQTDTQVRYTYQFASGSADHAAYTANTSPPDTTGESDELAEAPAPDPQDPLVKAYAWLYSDDNE